MVFLMYILKLELKLKFKVVLSQEEMNFWGKKVEKKKDIF